MNKVLLFVTVTLITTVPSLLAQSKTMPIAITIEPVEKTPVKLGTDVRISITVTNTSKEKVVFLKSPGPTHAGNWYDIVVSNTSGRSITKTRVKRILDGGGNVAGSNIALNLLPGDSVKEEAALNDLYELTTPGTYAVEVDRPFPDLHPVAKIKSNQISITLER
jgi:hypothetical protein